MAGAFRSRTKRVSRRPPTREPKKRVLVVTEGRVTEPEYLMAFAAWKREALVEVKISSQHGVPKTLVEIAKEQKANAEAAARRERDDNLRFDEVWCACDVDSHPRLPDARQMARDNGIELVVSNPCFELWLLLHYRENPGARHRRDLQRMLRREYQKDYDKHVDFDALKPGYEAAMARARRLDADADEAGEPGRNPTTGFHRLTASIAGE